MTAIQALRALTDRATPGPWRVAGYSIHALKETQVAHKVDRSDTEFIAACRTLVPALLDVVDMLRVAYTALERAQFDAHDREWARQTMKQIADALAVLEREAATTVAPIFASENGRSTTEAETL
jgi:excinuclease UvrABC ATPase subunit